MVSEINKASKKEKKSKDKKEKKTDKRKPDESIASSSKKTKPSTSDLKSSPSADFSYVEHPETSQLTNEDLQKFREKNAITFTGDREYKPILSFHQAGFIDEIMEFCKKFKAPTPIQSSTWPIILSKRDLIGIAQTGSGKTLAFALPAFMHLYRTKTTHSKKPKILVLAPTRELAMQSYEIFAEVGKLFGVNSACIYGGVSKKPQADAFKSSVQVVIATPGRLIDLFEGNSVNLSSIDYVVLDEADRMLDCGFEYAIRTILNHTAKVKQTVMLSATWPETIRKLASEFLFNPVKVTIGSDDLAVSHTVKQIVEVLRDDNDKEKRIIDLLVNYHCTRKNRVLIFVLYKKEAVRVQNFLTYKGYSVGAIHGDLSQLQRTKALAQFKDGSAPLLIATDVAARGLDIPNVEYVINYTFPLTIDDYVHRIGRTGRAGNKGISHTFFTSAEKPRSGELINVLKSANQDVPEALFKFGTTVKKKEHTAYGAFFKNIDPSVRPTKIVFDD